MRLLSSPAIASLGFLLLCEICSAEGRAVWKLNSSYTLDQRSLNQEDRKPWKLDNYPGSFVFLILRGPSSDVFTNLCLLSSPTSNSSITSMQEISFTLSIYMYAGTILYGGAIVWTANRHRPASGSSISLCLLSDGNLVLLGDDPDSYIWSSNTAQKGVTMMEVIQYPIVSLVLRNTSGGIVWQSADYPTDALTSNQYLLPGNKLISWATPTDPTPGAYSLAMEPSGLALYMGLEDAQPYWIWSYYGLNNSFSVKHTCKSSLLAAFLDPKGAISLTTKFPGSPVDVGDLYSPRLCSLQDDNHVFDTLPFKQYGTRENASLSNLTFLRLEHDGNLIAYSLGTGWSHQLDLFEENMCQLPNYCGSYGVCTSGSQCACIANSSLFDFVDSSNFSLGCRLRSKLGCNASSQSDQTMLPLSGVDYVVNNYTPALNISTEEACVDDCARNCSCMVAFWHRESNACHHADEVRSLHGSLDRRAFFTYVKVNSIPRDKSNSSKMVIIMASAVCGVFILVFIVLLLLYYWCKKFIQEEEDDDDDSSLLDATEGLPTRFTYKDLHQHTNGFQKQLGKGGFGPVYVGQLLDGTQVAVKKLQSFYQGNKEFKAEVAVMGRVSHANLLRLRGFCAQKGHRLLVYEYMENGSLDQWLFSDDKHRKLNLTWDARCKIALGVARGLAYLHHETSERIIHLDIKPQNILLDENFEAKVSDFGLSRLVSKSETHIMTTMRGTPGYLAPDWLKDGVINEKCDVFSFGMLLMEIVSGRRNLDYKVQAVEQVYYPEWAFWQAQKEDVSSLTDVVLGNQDDVLQLRRLINTAFLCVLEDPAMRPTMANVVYMLQGLVPVEEINLASLHQGLLFVLRNPSSFAKAQMGEAIQGMLGFILDVDSALETERSSGTNALSFSLSAG